METTFEFCIFISGKEKKQLQKCNTTILLSMHDKYYTERKQWTNMESPDIHYNTSGTDKTTRRFSIVVTFSITKTVDHGKKVGLIWFSSIRGEDLNVKVHDKRRTDDDGRQVMTKA
jgi:hypothetical protein